MARASNCPFCLKLDDPNGWPAEEIVWQFPHSVAVLGQWQYYTGYCVLISRVHAIELAGLGPDRAAYLDEMATLAQAIQECFVPHKLNYELLGNLVPHLHWHVFPRSADDPEKLRPVWFALDRAGDDAAEKLRLESGSEPRATVVTRLRVWLTSHGAPHR